MTEPLRTSLESLAREADGPRPPAAFPEPPPIPASRRLVRLAERAWPFLAWLLALAACAWLYPAGAGPGHAFAIEEADELKVSPSVAGRVATIVISPGQNVRQGDVLATLETRDLDRRITAAKDALERSRSKVAGRKKDSADPDPGLEKDLRIQETKIADLEAERRKYQVQAPTAGSVSRIAAKVGDRRSAGSDLIDLLVAHPQELTAFVTERQISTVAVGMAATMQSRDLAGPALEGKVLRLGPQIEQLPARLRSIPGAPQWGRKVVIEVKTPGPSLPGQVYDVRFH
jgi:multidrug resistance efflux pump